MQSFVDNTQNFRRTDGAWAKRWFHPVPLESLRETTSNDIPAAGSDANGGLLAKDTTPNLEFTNGDTDSAIRLDWAASNADPVTFSVPLPPHLDTSKDLTIYVLAAMAGATDIPVLDFDTFFGKGDTKVSDASAAVTGTSVAVYPVTIAASDIPKAWVDYFTMSVEITPAAHTTDVLYVYGISVLGFVL